MSLAHNPHITTNGLVFYLDAANPKCYSGSGTVVKNMITDIAGELVNSPSYSSNLNGYFSFVAGDYLRFPNDTALDSQQFTVEVFARTNNTTQNGFWFEKGTVNSQYNLFQEYSNIRWRANFDFGFVNMISVSTAAYINTTDWFHIVATHVSGNQKLYINSNQVGSNTITGTISTNNGGMSVGAYGGFSGGRGYYYNGDIAVVKVYNKALNADEVEKNFFALKGRYNI